jgi:hypothetical protein
MSSIVKESDGMEQGNGKDGPGLPEQDILGKGDWDYSIPFFGHRAPMLSDLIFQDDATITENNYTIIEKENGTIAAWIKAIPEEGRQIILWMKSTALYDSKGMFIGVMGKIRDITEEMGPELLNKTNAVIPGCDLLQNQRYPSTVSMFDKIWKKQG